MEKKSSSIIKYVPLLIIAMLIIVIIVASTSFGFFEYLKKSNTINKVTTANVLIEVGEDSSISISNENSLPMSDSDGKLLKPFVFDLRNIGGVGANYDIKLIDDSDAINKDGCSSIQMPKSSMRYELIQNNVVVSEGLLSSLINNSIDSGYISRETTYNYELRVWIDSKANTEIMGKHYHGKIEVVISDSLND